MEKRSAGKIIGISILIIFFIAGVIYANRNHLLKLFFKPTKTSLPIEKKMQTENKIYEVVAENLQIPWEVVFIPDGDILVTERPGTLRRIGKKIRSML